MCGGCSAVGSFSVEQAEVRSLGSLVLETDAASRDRVRTPGGTGARRSQGAQRRDLTRAPSQ